MLSQAAPKITPALFGLVFSEGLFAFLSPCILPMLPIYLLYLSGTGNMQENRDRLIRNTVGFICGFTLVFVGLGATASGLGSLLSQHRDWLQRIGGVIMIVFGLHFMGILRISFLNQTKTLQANTKDLRFFSSLLFGGAFSLGWTPCLGPFLGSALLLASNSSTLPQGIALLFVFSMGLGVPFLLTALLWDRLQGAMRFIKKHLNKIKMISGTLLIIVGLLMLFDLFGYYMGLFS
ncbi:cytochrome c biogenesis CcdA family protein [Oscillospiraceae bacterium MB08-C2-2]|nr:cytochrome c biogenesis CcdA family protein [Oscillospiraceae bacterium MB08-C2-2]